MKKTWLYYPKRDMYMNMRYVVITFYRSACWKQISTDSVLKHVPIHYENMPIQIY